MAVIITSKKEKKLWIFASIALAAIFLNLWLSGIFSSQLHDQDLIAIGFVIGMLLVAITIITHAFLKRINYSEIVVWIGLIAVYYMVGLRMTMLERSHLFEFGVLAIFFFEALKERKLNGKKVFSPPLYAILLTGFCGVIDESLQLLIPHRVFDPTDMFFNLIAAIMAVGGSIALSWVRQVFQPKNKTNQN
ncbi:MAG: VanZ family protein [Bacteroidia bacterium]|nr:VanZ family protein [Bacteroidia bacterium]NND26360.1 VanZ family protein [Flavobacteriaceae bacterium]MBT8278482.1 VanZ family protein [Bacteroidia bacterium]NNK59138.1 VanZ family protein [Flavobacteriaceae bacterium]NNL31700.1 VanZ family protein [Flavobacteriaceae bacterium]